MSRLRRAAWVAGTPARWALLGAIRLYQLTLSGAFGGGQCRFSPGCSRYAAEAIRTRGAIVGSALAIRRVLRCNPFGRGGFDPVPPRRVYDAALQSGSTSGSTSRGGPRVGSREGIARAR